MKCLWLSFHDPSPATNGQYLYSEGLIASAAAAGLELDVVALARPDGVHRDGERTDNVFWHLVPGGETPAWHQLFSLTPYVALRSKTAAMMRVVSSLLESQRYDAVVFDSICDGWAIDLPLLRSAGRPKLVHLAHNHEHTAARHMASVESHPLKRLVKMLDSVKVRILERRLVSGCDISTSNTPEDRATFAREHPDKTVTLLRPGYRGPKRAVRAIGPDVPRRAIVVGSFNWAPKRASLESFLNAAAQTFAANDIELHIVGAAEEAYLTGLRVRFPGVTFTGPVDDVYAPMNEARIALVPDTLGGFKLKSLDYVFNRIPIYALEGSVPGVPLCDRESVRPFADHRALAEGVTADIDNFPALNRQHELAFHACAGAFEWPEIGRGLADTIRAACAQPGDAAIVQLALAPV